MHNLKATFTTPTTKHAEPPSTPMVRCYSLVGRVGRELQDIATLRIYQGRGTTVRACFWLHFAEYRSGRGLAGGYGYDKVSAAAQDALTNAGIQLWGSPYAGREAISFKRRASISGVGDSAIEAALIAIGKLVAPRGKFRVVRN